MLSLYPTDLPDEHGAVIEPMLPPGKPGGRPRHVSSVYGCFQAWQRSGVWLAIHDQSAG
ncbi:transposase [Azospirillum sp.]|uniref:transposase n=1 Tax=Azospirillum sp. TaxID=34012 RepID=UPI003D749846